jgi:RNA 2',3'-cyclic 3'-phosphodiesterase
MKRIFIAIKVEPEKALLKIFSDLHEHTVKDQIKWTKVENVHVTLAFLGDTEESIIKNISQMLHEICADLTPFELKMKGTGVFRSYSDPRIIWTGIEPSDRLKKLNELIISGLRNLNIDPGDKPFNPHLTLGRIKHLNDKDSFKILIQQYQNTDIQKIPVTEVVLFESILLPTGPVYKPIIKVQL